MNKYDTTLDAFYGAWNLIEMSLRNGDESVHYPNGRHAKGLLIYTKDGRMSAQIGNPERKRHEGRDYRYPTREELAENYPDFISYYGKIEMAREKGAVVHKVEMSLFPNWTGTGVKRKYAFSNGGKRLTLTATPIPQGGRLLTPTLIWEKVEEF